tara:strand:- start:156 stop:335 length:180 start_codon:yes stop_codon:yes gene_type:complete
MFIADEAATAKSQVTFFRCSICLNKHVSCEPVMESSRSQASSGNALFSTAADSRRLLTV